MTNAILTRLSNLLRRTTGSGNWIPEIDGLRFVALLPVVLQHLLERFSRATATAQTETIQHDPVAFFINRGTIGVFLFFAISGFVVAMPFARHFLDGTDKVSLKRFYGRRLTRIEPPYLIWMTVFTLVLLVQGAWSVEAIWPHWLAGMTYTHCLIFKSYAVMNPVAWSLEIEIQFYLLAPLLAACYFSIRNTNTRRMALAGFLLALTAIQYMAGWWFTPFKMTLAGQLQHFLVGFLLLDFYLTNWKTKQTSHYAWDLAAVAAFIIMSYTWTTEFWKNIAFILALGVLFTAAFKGILFRKMLSNNWIAITGGMCYTIYLIHLPLLQGLTRYTAAIRIPGGFWINFCAQAAIMLPLIWAVSVAGYLLIERPFMRPGKTSSFNFLQGSMKKYASISIITILLISGLVSSSLIAQEIVPVKTTGTGDSLRLKPMNTIIEMVVRQAPEIKANQIDAAKQTAAVSIQRKSWMDLISANGSMLYGNGTVLDNNQDAVGSRYLLTGRKSLGSNVSLSIRISGGDVANRRQKVAIQKLQLERIQVEKEEIEQHLRIEAIGLYNQLELSIQMVRSKADAFQTLQITSGIAEKYFREGTLPVSEYTTLLSKISTAQDQFIQAQAETKKLAQLLRERCGGEIWMF
jgi:peptidoglycan/LPS O-acetylase OafA/YrhL